MSYLESKSGSISEVVKEMQKHIKDNAYQDMFKKELEKAGKGIGSMTPAEKKAFFNKIDDKYKAKNEDIKEAVDNPYAVGMSQAMKSTGDKPPLKKSTITKAHDIAKSIEKDEKNEEKDVPKGYHKMPDGTVMKDSEHKKETHSFMTKDMNKSKKDAKGEKEIVDPAPKMKFKEAYKKVKKEAMNTVGDATADQANQRVGEGPKENDPDIKKPKIIRRCRIIISSFTDLNIVDPFIFI